MNFGDILAKYKPQIMVIEYFVQTYSVYHFIHANDINNTQFDVYEIAF
jgi:hypothetical protein